MNNKHTFAPWFLRPSLEADYGEYVCDRCSNVFFHSPSTIKQDGKVIFNCCCGNCTNEIISADYGEKPYS